MSYESRIQYTLEAGRFFNSSLVVQFTRSTGARWEVRARGAFAQVLVPSPNGREKQEALGTSLDKTRLYKAKKETLLY